MVDKPTKTAGEIGDVPSGIAQERDRCPAAKYFIVGMGADDERLALSHT